GRAGADDRAPGPADRRGGDLGHRNQPPRARGTADGDGLMNAFAAAGAAFLLAVLWFDLMFDAQVRRHASDPLPREVLASISGYCRRVTPEAFPMNRLVALVMLFTLVAIVAEIVEAATPWWISWGSLVIAGSGFGPTLMRTVPNARRLGSAR